MQQRLSKSALRRERDRDREDNAASDAFEERRRMLDREAEQAAFIRRLARDAGCAETTVQAFLRHQPVPEALRRKLCALMPKGRAA